MKLNISILKEIDSPVELDHVTTLLKATEYRVEPPYTAKLPVCPHCNTISYRIKPYIEEGKFSKETVAELIEFRTRIMTKAPTSEIKGD